MWHIHGSLKSSGVLYSYPPQIFPREWQWVNYLEVFRIVPFLLFARNSVIITVTALTGQVLISALVAYGFARFRFRGRNVLFVLLLSTMMLPQQVILIPQYLLYAQLRWIDTYLPLIVPFWFGHAFSVFLLRQFFMTVPRDFDDAARIDGANPWIVFWRILMPLIQPALIAVGILGFRSHWNSFIDPLIYLNSTSKYTLLLGLSYIKSNYLVDSGGDPHENWLMAASIMVTIPTILMFFVLQRHIVRGVVLSGLKQWRRVCWRGRARAGARVLAGRFRLAGRATGWRPAPRLVGAASAAAGAPVDLPLSVIPQLLTIAPCFAAAHRPARRRMWRRRDRAAGAAAAVGRRRWTALDRDGLPNTVVGVFDCAVRPARWRWRGHSIGAWWRSRWPARVPATGSAG